MKRTFLMIPLMLILAAALFAPALAQTGAAVEGRVLDAATGAPIAGAQIALATGATAVTDAGGRFVISGLAVAEPHIVTTIGITAPGYGAWTMTNAALYPNDRLLLGDIRLTSAPQQIDAGGVPTVDELPPAEFREPPTPDVAAQFWSHSIIPPTIRVALTGYRNCGYRDANGTYILYPITSVVTLDFKEYVKGVLPHEWITSWNGASLRAGAMAVKMYAWWKINIGPRGTWNGQDYDVRGDTCDQVYVPNSQYVSTNAAVDDTWGYLMRRNSQVIRIHYADTEDTCVRANLSPCMAQWGSKSFGDQGYDWQWILNYYYTPIEITLGAPPTATPTPIPTAPAEVDLITNGTFANGVTDWGFWNTTTSATNGQMQIRRNPGTGDGGFFQFVAPRVPAAAPLELRWNLGNLSSAPRSVTILLRNASWAETRPCGFVLQPFTPMQTFVLRTVTTTAWQPIIVQGWLGETDTQPALVFDDIQLRYRPSQTIAVTECTVEPPANTNLFFNGDFSAGFESWGHWNLHHTINGGAVLAGKQAGTPNGGFFQWSPFNAPANGVFEYTFSLGNTSSQARTVHLLFRNPTWTDMRSCWLTLPPNAAPRAFMMRFRSLTAWSNIVFQAWLQQDDGVPTVRFDDFALRYTPGAAIGSNVECPLVPAEWTPDVGLPAAPVDEDKP